MSGQQFTSRSTCRKQVSALHRALLRAEVWSPGDANIDIGGGRWDLATELMAEHGVRNLVYDPYNRSLEHNDLVLTALRAGEVRTATVANTLNVIAEASERLKVIQLASIALDVAYFYGYEGDKSGLGGATRDGWQENRKLADYVPEVAQVFSVVCLRQLGGLRVIEARMVE